MSYQRRTIPGHFSRRVGPQHVGISEEEARRLLAPTNRDVDEATATLKSNPLASLKSDNCLVVFEVHSAPAETVADGGPHLVSPASYTDEETAEFLLDLIAQVAPASYNGLYDRYHELQPPQVDAFVSSLMEQLDNVAGPEITFTVQEVNGTQVLGFYRLEMPEPSNLEQQP